MNVSFDVCKGQRMTLIYFIGHNNERLINKLNNWNKKTNKPKWNERYKVKGQWDKIQTVKTAKICFFLKINTT